MAETTMRHERVALGAGVLFGIAQVAVVVLFGALVAPHMPPLDAPLTDHVSFYEQHGTVLALVNYVAVTTIPLLLVFIGGIFGVVRRAEGGAGVLTVTAVASALAVGVISASGIAVAHAGQMSVSRGLGGAEAFAMDSVAQLAVGFAGFPRAILVVTVAVALREARQMGRVGFGVGAGIAALAVVGTADFLVPAMFAPAALANVLAALWLAGVALGQLRATAATGALRPQPA